MSNRQSSVATNSNNVVTSTVVVGPAGTVITSTVPSPGTGTVVLLTASTPHNVTLFTEGSSTVSTVPPGAPFNSSIAPGGPITLTVNAGATLTYTSTITPTNLSTDNTTSTTLSDTTTPEYTGKRSTLSTTITASRTGPIATSFVIPVSDSPKPSNRGISSGAAAGIAIATAIIGAIIATVIMLVLQRNKKRRSKSSRSSNYTPAAGRHPGGHTERVLPGGSEKTAVSTQVVDPDFLLPQPKDDQAMATVVSQFFMHIGNHVENFYHNDSLGASVESRSEEQELMVRRATRHFAIKRYICREMLAAIAWDCDPEHSLLSAIATLMAQRMSRGNLDETTYEVVWSRWRVSTALLLKAESSNQKQQAREYWLDRLQKQLGPFQVRGSEAAAGAQEDLLATCKLAEQMASLVCSQPARWEFHWPRDEGRNHFVIFPEFVRVTDDKAKRLERPKRMLEAQRTG